MNTNNIILLHHYSLKSLVFHFLLPSKLIQNKEKNYIKRINLTILKFMKNKLYTKLFNCNFAHDRYQRPIE